MGLDDVIEESDFGFLRTVRLTDLDGVTERADLFLPTLEEYLSICRKYEKTAVLELKREMEEKHVKGIAETVRDTGMLDSTVFISFCGNNLVMLKKHFPEAAAQFLASEVTEQNIRFVIDNDLEADFYFGAITSEFVERMHALGRRVNVWTVNDVETALRMKEMGVDMITTNILE